MKAARSTHSLTHRLDSTHQLLAPAALHGAVEFPTLVQHDGPPQPSSPFTHDACHLDSPKSPERCLRRGRPPSTISASAAKSRPVHGFAHDEDEDEDHDDALERDERDDHGLPWPWPWTSPCVASRTAWLCLCALASGAVSGCEIAALGCPLPCPLPSPRRLPSSLSCSPQLRLACSGRQRFPGPAGWAGGLRQHRRRLRRPSLPPPIRCWA